MSTPSPQNATAQTLKLLHKPGDPLVLTNVWDAISASAVASLPGTKALATASAAIAQAAGIPDDDLTLSINLHAVRGIVLIAQKFNKPLTVDMQDGFGAELESGVRQVIQLGAVGMNLEDFAREKGGLYTLPEAQERIRRVMNVAREQGVPDFVLNARTDSLFAGAGIDEAIERGKAYLEAGASNVFIWGGPSRKGWRREEVARATRELGGRLNVILIRREKGGLGVGELKEMGVARISLGPQLVGKCLEAVGEEARRVLEGERV